MKYLNIVKTRNVKTPTRAYKYDAGLDFYIPNDYSIVYLLPNNDILIPSGIKIQLKKSFVGVFLNKSSVASNLKLLVGAQVIDSSYTGEVHLNLHNVGSEEITLKPGQKIAQLVIYKISTPKIKLVNQLKKTKRGSKGFGSTGTGV